MNYCQSCMNLCMYDEVSSPVQHITLFMHPVHKCSQDCETLHKEISKKIFLILLNSRINSLNTEASTIINKNNWFGLETPLGRSGEILKGQEETIKTFLCGKEEKEIKVLVYLDNEEGLIGVEEGDNGKKASVRKGKVILEIWTLKFNPRNVDDHDGNEGEIRKLYKRTTLYIRSLFTISRLLPSYPLLQQQKLPLKIEIETEETINPEILSESLITSDEGDGKTFEVVNSTSLSVLQTTHGDLEIGVQFKKLQGKFYTIVRSPAIRVPQQVIKAKDIQINSSPAGSGDWIDMTQQNMYTLRKQNSATTTTTTTTMGQIKILTTAHKPGGSSLATETNMKKHQTSLTDFIKIFEKPLELSFPSPTPLGPAQLIEKLELGRSKKILFDRWLEELEIEHESLISGGFDLINNME